MRDIKFRAWNGIRMEQDIIVGRFGAFYVNPGEQGNGLDPNDSASLNPCNTLMDKCPVMQYTGLKDKNDKEIYEGDIVKDLGGNIWKVYWDDEAASIAIVNEVKTRSVIPRCIAKYHQVIGNIYENPDLIQ